VKILTTVLCIIAAISLCHAGSTTYVNGGLDRETVVMIEINDGKVVGAYRQHGYDGENPVEATFTGKTIKPPSGKKGVYMEIQFKGPVPYDTKEGKIIWCLRSKNGDKKLYLPIIGRDFTTVPPKIKSYEIELEALSANFEGD
jgi:hypothetical protein